MGFSQPPSDVCSLGTGLPLKGLRFTVWLAQPEGFQAHAAFSGVDVEELCEHPKKGPLGSEGSSFRARIYH